MTDLGSSPLQVDLLTLNSASDSELKLPPRPWLEIDSGGTSLTILDSKSTRVSKPRGLQLDVVFPDGTNLLEGRNFEWLRLVLSFLYLLRDEKEKRITTAAAHCGTVDRLLTFLKWARLNHVYDLRRMTPALVERYSSEIALGTGFALRYAERIQDFVDRTKDELPTKEDKTYPKRRTLDIGAICEAIHISVQSLSADRVASQLLARLSARYGYHAPNRQAVTSGPLPEPLPVKHVTHSRHIEVLRLLHVWNDQLHGAGLLFMPCPATSDGLRSKRLSRTGHTENIPPREVMTLLNEALRWIYDFGPQVLDLFDDVEAKYEDLVAKAASLDRWTTLGAVAALRKSFSRFLQEQDDRGAIPHGAHKVVRRYTNFGYDIARRILSGDFTPQSRRAAIEWLGLSNEAGDREIYQLARHQLAKEHCWSTTWPFSPNQLAKSIGISSHSLKSFVAQERFHEPKVYERIDSFLVANGVVHSDGDDGNVVLDGYRSDRGIEKALKNFVSNHPINKSGNGDFWPLSWNITHSSRDGSTSLYQALRFYIPTAALIVLGVFQARRESELTSLTTSCIDDSSEELWMETHVAKTLRRDKKLPTVDLPKAAVELLSRWSSRGRTMTGSDLLFSYWEPLGRPVKTVKPNVDLKKFAQFVLESPISKRIQVRQFRRFFAMSYMWRYRLGSLPALSEFLCHSGISMTWEYVTERVGTSVMLEAQSEFSKEILISAAIGKTKLKGPFGRLWSRWVEKVRSQIRTSISFTEDEDLEQSLLVQRIEASGRMLLPTPGGFCSAGERTRDVTRAKCSTPDPLNPDRMIKNPELSRPGLCAACPFAATDDEHRDFWQAAARDARAAASQPNPSLLRERARLDVAKLERIANAFDASRDE